jgi:hypothetical protein
MSNTASSARINITAANAAEADYLLDRAAGSLQRQAAGGDRRGILAIRRGAGQYTLELSDAVPYGMTREVLV